MYYFYCGHIDNECDWEEYADTQQELEELVIEHLKLDHGLDTIPKSLLTKIKEVIQEVEESGDWDEEEEEEEEEEDWDEEEEDGW